MKPDVSPLNTLCKKVNLDAEYLLQLSMNYKKKIPVRFTSLHKLRNIASGLTVSATYLFTLCPLERTRWSILFTCSKQFRLRERIELIKANKSMLSAYYSLDNISELCKEITSWKRAFTCEINLQHHVLNLAPWALSRVLKSDWMF